MTRFRFRIVACTSIIVLASCGLFDRLRTKPDSGAIEPKIDLSEASVAQSDAAPIEGGLASLLGLFGDPEDEPQETTEAGTAPPCPVPIHPGYCRGRCKGFSERKSFPHAQRIFPSAGVAFGTCGSLDVFSEKEPDGGGITEYFDKGSLVAAIDTRQKCGKYGTIPSCKPVLAWDAGFGTGGLGSLGTK